MKNQQTQLSWIPAFKVDNLDWIWENKKWIRCPIPWVFEYHDNNWIKQLIYERGWLYIDINWNTVDAQDVHLSQKKEVVTKVDLLNFQWLTESEIEILINRELFTKEDKEKNLTLDSAEWINKINDIFRWWYEFLWIIWRKVPDKYSSFTMFSDKKEVIEFCKITQNSSTKKAYINCLMAKSSFVVSDIINNEDLEKLSNKEEVLLQLLKNREEFNFTSESKWVLEIYWEKIKFSVRSRAKSKLSAQLKMWKDPSYYSSNIMWDWLWLTFYIENKDDSTIFLEHINKVFNENEEQEDDCKIETKWGFVNPEDNKWRDKISYFLNKIIVKKPKDSTNDDYWDLKGIFNISIPNTIDEYDKWIVWDKVKTEIKIVDFDSTNDDWLSFQPIYWYFKYIETLIRFLQWYVSENEIDSIVDIFFYNIENSLREKNKLMPEWKEKNKNDYLKELELDLIKENFINIANSNRGASIVELKEWLKKYYLNNLIEVKVWKKRNAYLTNQREYNLSLAWYRQSMELINS